MTSLRLRLNSPGEPAKRRPLPVPVSMSAMGVLVIDGALQRPTTGATPCLANLDDKDLHIPWAGLSDHRAPA
jgi:hypothetical protein